MKKAISLLIGFFVLSFSLHGGDFDTLPFKAIDGAWMSESIHVNSSDGSADVMTLLRAFHSAWPTEAVESLIAEVGDRLFVSNDATDCDDCTGHVYVDCEDFNCAYFINGEADPQLIEARAYPRENGHTLFGICLEDHGDEETVFCCFYDYDPDTRLMTPEEVPYVNLQRKWSDSRLSYQLGMEYDLTFIVQETSPDGEYWFHHYYYNGMKHIYHHSGEKGYTDEDEDEEYFEE